MRMRMRRIVNKTTMKYDFDGISVEAGGMKKILYFDDRYRVPVNLDVQEYDKKGLYWTIVEIAIFNLSRATYYTKEIEINDDLSV